MATWKSNRPSDEEQIKDLGPLMQSNRSALNSAMQQHIHWSDETANTGSLLTASGSSFTGTARFHYGTESQISQPDKGDGSGMVISDTTRVGAFVGGAYVPLGGSRHIVGLHWGYADTWNRHYGIAQNSKMYTQIGAQLILDADASSADVTFPVAYSSDDVKVFIQDGAQGSISAASYHYALHSVTKTGFSIDTLYIGNATVADAPDAALFYWKSVGTVSL